MKFEALAVALELIRALRPVIARIRRSSATDLLQCYAVQDCAEQEACRTAAVRLLQVRACDRPQVTLVATELVLA